MIVTLDNNLFDNEEVDDAILIQVLKWGGQGKFRVRCSPAYRPNADQPVNHWIAKKKGALTQTTLEKINDGLVRGTEPAEYVFPAGVSELRIRLQYGGEPDWPADRRREICLPLTDTSERFLANPLSVLVEDSDSDWKFLKKVVPDIWKKWFFRLIEKNWVVPDHCGGIPTLERRIKDTIVVDPQRKYRCFAFFDSESNSRRRRLEGRTSHLSPSEKAEALCKTHDIPCHRLYRRATENYVPKASLLEWAGRAPPSNRERHEKLRRAFLDLPTDEHRHFFPCKNGISQAENEARAGEGSSIYDGLSVPDLQKGFAHGTKEHLADIWTDHSYIMEQSYLAEDGSLPEMTELFLKLLAAV